MSETAQIDYEQENEEIRKKLIAELPFEAENFQVNNSIRTNLFIKFETDYMTRNKLEAISKILDFFGYRVCDWETHGKANRIHVTVWC